MNTYVMVALPRPEHVSTNKNDSTLIKYIIGIEDFDMTTNKTLANQ